MKAADIRRIFARPPRRSNAIRKGTLTARQRTLIRKKTAGACHVCGGSLARGWQADHVIHHQLGGTHCLDNYLPICRECNRLRWSYTPRVLRLIMRFGVYTKHEIRQDSELGRQLIRLAARLSCSNVSA